jgi:putative redox protein
MAISTLKLTTTVKDGFKTEVSCSNNFIVDQPAPMSKNEGPNPLELLLASLGSCICAIGRIVSNQERLNVRGISVNVEGDIDKDYLMGKTTQGRAGFTDIRTNVTIDADMSYEDKVKFIEKVEQLCPIADNILTRSKITTVIAR